MGAWPPGLSRVRLSAGFKGLHRSILPIFLSMLCAGGCSTTPIGRSDLIDFLKDGVSSREEVILQLGDPGAMYEDSRILTYRLSRDEAGWFVRETSKGWTGILANLVLVFDEKGVLKRHSLVQVRAP